MNKLKCRYCEKEIEGYSESQTEYMMMQHLLSKHREKMKFDALQKHIQDLDEQIKKLKEEKAKHKQGGDNKT